MIPRVLPVLLLEDGGLVKTVRFGDPRYVGDPINAVRIFNEKEADELVLLDIRATTDGRPPDLDMIEEIVSEAFMPLAFGGGVRDLQMATDLIQVGIEKIVLNALTVEDPDEVRRMSDRLGRSTIVAGIDATETSSGRYEVVTRSATVRTGRDVRAHAEAVAALGAGEIFLNAVHRDGTMTGYDIKLVRQVRQVVDIPVVACGGAGTLDDLATVVDTGGASAAAAGSLFVFHGRHRAILITYPSYARRKALYSS